jgi:glucose/arabinose dehydrogenase/cytochrome c2
MHVRQIHSRGRVAIGAIAAVSLLTIAGLAGRGQTPTPAASTPAFGPWLEADAPFFSSVVDARQAGGGLPATNLAPRALVIRAGPEHWLAFDPDLLRVVAVWQGSGVTPTALAPGSYHKPDRKTPAGQKDLPAPDGAVRIANGIYPGWVSGPTPQLVDPRTPAPSPEEVGRGALPQELGQFRGLQLTGRGVVLEYDVAATAVKEWVTSAGRGGGARAVLRVFDIAPSRSPLWLVVGVAAKGHRVSLLRDADAPADLALTAASAADSPTPVTVVRVPAHAAPLRFAVAMAPLGVTPPATVPVAPTDLARPRWPAEVSTRVVASSSTDALAIDDVELPLVNPWRRNVRLSDIQFLADGTGVGITLDGDVWLARDIAAPSGVVRWKRFASGLHEPLSLAVRDDQIFAFDRNGVWRLHDVDGDGEADRHELFSNAFAQTADSREFPSTIRLGPAGEFVIAKGGQEATTIGKHNGSVLRLSADGRRATVLGYGLRQPQIAVHPVTGLVTGSDQQGHYIPSTPLHIIRDRQFYGFLSDILPREVYPAPIAAPLTWIPHSVNASGMSQVWLTDARMGPLDNGLVHIAYNRPELFRVLPDFERRMPQAAVVSLTTAFEHPPLNGAVNPADGQLYIAGFQIIGWGTTATRMAGLSRVRYTGAPVLVPRQVTPMIEGVLLRFDTALDPSHAVDVANYRVTTWQYRRTYKYGSPQFKADGTPGTDVLAPSRVYVSNDRRAVFVAVPDMRPVMQMEIGWTIRSAAGQPMGGSAYTTPYALTAFASRAEGFGDLVLDLTRRATPLPPPTVASAPTADDGRALFVKYGCLACHATERGTAPKMGPTLAGLYGTSRRIADRATPVTVDDAYLRQSIVDPTAMIADGYARGGVGMPSFQGVLTDAQIESLILFVRSLK